MRCKKDTVEVLEIILPPINISLEHLRNSRVSVQINSDLTLVRAESEYFNQGIPIRVYLAGDLALVNDALGKRNMSGNWCPYCRINKERRSLPNHNRAAP
jgi:hypothetical protein